MKISCQVKIHLILSIHPFNIHWVPPKMPPRFSVITYLTLGVNAPLVVMGPVGFFWVPKEGCRQVGRNQDLKFSLKPRPGQHWSNTLVLTGVVRVSHFRPNLWISIEYIFIYKRRKICISKKSDIYYAIHPVTCYFIYDFFLPVMNMLIFNFHKIMDMHKGYAYQFSDFIAYNKPRIGVCVCVLVLCTQRKQ